MQEPQPLTSNPFSGTAPITSPTPLATPAAEPVISAAGSKPKGSNKILIYSLIIILLIVFGGAVTYVVMNYKTLFRGEVTTDNTSLGTMGTPPAGSEGTASSAGSISQTVTSSGYLQDGGSVTKDGVNYAADGNNNSAIIVSNSAVFNLTNAKIISTSSSTSADESSFYGLNAAVLVKGASQMVLSDSTINATGTGANGAFATDAGSKLTLDNVTINAVGGGAHGVMATQGGEVAMNDVDIITTLANSAAVATDRGGGTINVTGGTLKTTGQDSPGIYSTGVINVTDADIIASGAEAAVIEGANQITLTNTTLRSTFEDKQGVMMYQSMSGDAAGVDGTFTMTGGTLAYTSKTGPLFYSTNATSNIYLNEVDLGVASKELLKASAGKWGTSGANGGTAILTANDQELSGSVVVDNISSATIVLQNSSNFVGTVDNANTAKLTAMSIDSTSTFELTANSYITTLPSLEGISGNNVSTIIGNGFNIYYDASNSVNSYLNSGTYDLVNGGQLLPE